MILPFTIKNADVINPLCAQTFIVVMLELTPSPYKKGRGVEKDAISSWLCVLQRNRNMDSSKMYENLMVSIMPLCHLTNNTAVFVHFSGLRVRMNGMSYFVYVQCNWKCSAKSNKTLNR